MIELSIISAVFCTLREALKRHSTLLLLKRHELIFGNNNIIITALGNGNVCAVNILWRPTSFFSFVVGFWNWYYNMDKICDVYVTFLKA